MNGDSTLPGQASVEPADQPETWQGPAWGTDSEMAPTGADALIVDVDGFGGPLDLLLALSRTHKIDISKISIVKLVDQYLSYISRVQSLKIEIAADYLVMAAWLAYLKSRLLLPKEKDLAGDIPAEELAQRLAFRLMRLDAMRGAMAQLMTKKRLGQDVFCRGEPEVAKTFKETQWTAEIYDLLKAYAEQRKRTIKVVHVVKMRKVWSIKEARGRLEKLMGATGVNWAQLDMFLETYLPTGDESKTAIASSFGATLEMSRDGLVELRQEEPFAPIYMRKRGVADDWTVMNGGKVAEAE